ncbi:MAG: DUF4397 domain-containing protein [Pedobacter sp.]|nr:MAG: DUF4397 domain-containing protein [Pedobacter sp.]
MTISNSFSFKNLRFFTLIAILMVVLGASCKKDDVDERGTSFVRFINASPTYATYNVYLDDVKVNMSGALPFGGTVNYKLYYEGPHTIKLTTASNPTAILDKNFSIGSATNYSCYLIEKGAALDWIVMEDKGDVFSTTEAMLKFVNLSPDANGLSLRIKDGAELATSKPYKSDTPYQKLEAKKVTLELVHANSGQVLATLADVDLKASTYFTILAKGYMNPGENEHGISIQSIVAAQ